MPFITFAASDCRSSVRAATRRVGSNCGFQVASWGGGGSTKKATMAKRDGHPSTSPTTVSSPQGRTGVAGSVSPTSWKRLHTRMGTFVLSNPHPYRLRRLVGKGDVFVRRRTRGQMAQLSRSRDLVIAAEWFSLVRLALRRAEAPTSRFEGPMSAAPHCRR
jgi:hypothetical protein